MSRFKQGDRVRELSSPYRWGTIEHINHYDNPNCFVVLYDGEWSGAVEYAEFVNHYPDPTIAFLTELQELMKLYNAEIKYTYDNPTDDDCPLICIHGKELWYKEYTALTPDNIFDYKQ